MSHWSSGLPICFLSWGTRVHVPSGVPLWNQESPVSVVLLHWSPRMILITVFPCPSVGASLGSAPTMCKPTWSHTALLSRFHARCRSSFQLHNGQSWLLGGSPVESLQSHFIHTMSHWSCGLPDCFPSWRTWVQIPRGVLMWNRDSRVSVFSLQYLDIL